MKKNLEDFIRENRAEFDNEEPSPQVWKNLEKEFGQKEKKTGAKVISFRKWVAAAAVVTAISAGAYFMFLRNQDPTLAATDPAGTESTQSPGSADNDLLDEINPTYAKEVYHFTQLIELKQNELKQIGKDQPELYKQFMKDITALDSSYNNLQKELPANPNQEQLLEAMIQNLQLQTDLLNQQLRVIKEIKQSKKGTNESNSKII